jgi:hypothetical protein
MNGDRCYGVTDAEKINENNRLKEEKQSHRTWSGLPDFSWYSTPKRGKYPNDYKIYRKEHKIC